uniref:Uncharacterized protein n=1 Tax=Glossina palpalis gambiensis TaxID=67801 RepID=A0A1B0B1I6_9MUSC
MGECVYVNDFSIHRNSSTSHLKNQDIIHLVVRHILKVEDITIYVHCGKRDSYYRIKCNNFLTVTVRYYVLYFVFIFDDDDATTSSYITNKYEM